MTTDKPAPESSEQSEAETDVAAAGDSATLSPGSTPPFAMLIVFGILAMAAFLATLEPPSAANPDNLPNVAHSPAEFRDRLTIQSVENLEPGSGSALAISAPIFEHPEDQPCSDCHEGDPGDPTPREMSAFHDYVTLDHNNQGRWCFDCHDPNNRDMLHLSNGELVPFTQSHRVCGQCHITQLRDWEVGVHGRLSGYFTGQRHYLLCAHCHDPHDPDFKPMEPLPPPVAWSLMGDAISPRDALEAGADSSEADHSSDGEDPEATP